MNTNDDKPSEEKASTGRDLAEAVAGIELTEEEASRHQTNGWANNQLT